MSNKLISMPVHFFNVTNETKDDRLLKIKIYGISEGETRNDSTFTLESMEKAMATVPLSVILAMYDEKVKDVKGHELELKYDLETGETYYSFHKGERIIGIIPQDSTIAIEELNGKKWLVYTGYIFSNYNYEIKKMLQKSKTKKISVEIKVDKSTILEDGMERIEEFTLLGTTILGDKLTTGIADAKLDLLEFSQKNVACFAQQVNEELTKSKSDIVPVIANMEAENGKGNAIKINLTKASASTTAWGSVDKTKLRNDILNASNYTALVKACYLLVEDGWEEHPSESLGYPVCQIVNGKLVYNINGINSAYSRLEGEDDQTYYNSVHAKLMKIRKKMGLDDNKNHIKFEGGNAPMKEKLIALFAETGKYKYLGSTEKSVMAFSIEDKKFVIIPFEVKDENIVMEEEKAKDAEVYAKPVEGEEPDEGDKEEFGCHEMLSETFVEVDTTKKELEAKDETITKMEAEKVEIEAKLMEAEKEKETFTTEKVEMESKFAEVEKEKTFAMEEIKKYKTIQFTETLKDLTRLYKLSSDESKDWESKIETFSEVKDLEVAVLMQFHEKQKQFSADNHMNLGGVTKVAGSEKKRAVDKLKENK